jgi:hypothetical protein
MTETPTTYRVGDAAVTRISECTITLPASKLLPEGPVRVRLKRGDPAPQAGRAATSTRGEPRIHGHSQMVHGSALCSTRSRIRPLPSPLTARSIGTTFTYPPCGRGVSVFQSSMGGEKQADYALDHFLKPVPIKVFSVVPMVRCCFTTPLASQSVMRAPSIA